MDKVGKVLQVLGEILIVVVLIFLVLLGITFRIWNDPGDPPATKTPAVNRTPRGGEPEPRMEVPGSELEARGSDLEVRKDGGISMEELMIGGVPLVALIVALVELAKQTMGLDSQYAPVVAVVLGIALAVGIQVSQIFPLFGTWFQVIVLGMVAGLLACGIYSGVKATRGG